jgi:hypothetical protein
MEALAIISHLLKDVLAVAVLYFCVTLLRSAVCWLQLLGVNLAVERWTSGSHSLRLVLRLRLRHPLL